MSGPAFFRLVPKVWKSLRPGIALLASALILQCGTVSYADTAEEHFRNALQFRFQGESEAAIAEYRRGLKLSPDMADSHAQLGSILMDENGDLDGAISEFVTALGIDPHCRFCQLALNDALDKRSSTSADQITRGNQFYASGALKRAMAAYRIAIYLDPLDGNAHNSLAWTLYRVGKLDEGLQEVNQALSLKPQDPEFVNTLASLQFDQGNLSAAADNFKKAISLTKVPNPADLYGLAVIAVTRGDTTAAAHYFNEALKIDPKYTDADYLRDRVGLSAKTLSSHERLVSLLAKQ